MNARVREILKRMEAHCLAQTAGESPVRTTHGGLDDRDTFSNSGLSLMGVLNLKRVLTHLDEPVTNEHYNTAYSARSEYVNGHRAYTTSYLISEDEYKVLAFELDRPRNLPGPELPDREINVKEKARVLNMVENALREFGYVNNPHSQMVYVKVPKGNGMDTTEVRVQDSSIGRRLDALYKELTSLRNAVTPMIAKDKTPYEGQSYWTTGDQWRKEHQRTCHSCGSVCDVSTWKWEEVTTPKPVEKPNA